MKYIEVGDRVQIKEDYSFAYAGYEGIVLQIDPEQGLPYLLGVKVGEDFNVLRRFYDEELIKLL